MKATVVTSPRITPFRRLVARYAGAKYALSVCKTMLARRGLFRVWQAAHQLSLYGMGFRNAIPHLNGEEFVARFVLEGLLGTQKPMLIFDVGSNRGEFISFFESVAPTATIHCFEPSETCFDYLKERFGSNRRIILNNVAVNDTGGSTTFFEPEEGSISSTTLKDVAALKVLQGKGRPEADGSLKKHVVSAISLDQYAAQAGIKDVSYVKIDVEGGELSVLEGMQGLIRENRVRYIQLEINDCNLLTGLTILRIAQMFPGWDVFRIVPNGLVRLVGPGLLYDSSCEIFQYSNCLIAPRSDNIVKPIAS